MSNELLDPPKKSPWPWIAGAVALVAIGGGAFVLAPKGGDKPKPRKVDTISIVLPPRRHSLRRRRRSSRRSRRK
ncbi:hypothetical protein KBB96_02380 [Luteolibacter ambystomatis]|uniref:Uncharacterized protein n=1 Tax=Luteolibacter ambystomatis TaxID=2824561 RepID=A0A975PF82_9BACT|nr:hypothetical protein [Luteolibacter ambystomatis]QUE51745.1 hypothetical protein KBB96_02380 [Luteolibacter ambystomatis]